MPRRALAHVDLSAIAANVRVSARAADRRRRALRGGQGRRLRPRHRAQSRQRPSRAARRGSPWSRRRGGARRQTRTRRADCWCSRRSTTDDLDRHDRDGRRADRLVARADRVDIERAAMLLDREVKLHIKLDTGMGRFGARDGGRGAGGARGSRRVRFASSRSRLDPLRDGRRARRRLLPAAARAFHRVRGGSRASYPGAARARCQQRRAAARARQPLRFRALRNRDLRTRSVRGDAAARGLKPGAQPALVRCIGPRRCRAGESVGYGRSFIAEPSARASPRSRSDTATAGGASSPTTATC